MEPLFPEARGGEFKSLSERLIPRLPPVDELDDAELLRGRHYATSSVSLMAEIEGIEHMLLDEFSLEEQAGRTRLRGSDRAKARDSLPRLRRELAEVLEREHRSLERGRPVGCWCLGAGGAGSKGRMLGDPIDVAAGQTGSSGEALMIDRQSGLALEGAAAYCTCAEGTARREREGHRRLDWLAGYQQGREFEQFMERWRASGLPDVNTIYPLEQYPQDSRERRETMAAVMAWRPPQGLYLWGNYRLGKTTIAQALGVKALRKGYTVKFWKVSKLLDHLRSGFDRGISQEDLMAELTAPDFLFLDDIGASPAKEYAFDRLLQMLDDRLERRVTTVLTSNFPLGEEDDGLINVLLGTDTPATPQRLAFAHRIVARIRERSGASVVEVKGLPLRVPTEQMPDVDW